MREVVSLPPGWAITTLGEVHFDKSTDVVPSRTPDKWFELYSVPSFSSERPEIVLGQDIGSNKQVVCPGAVLVCKINPRINRIWVVGNRTQHDKIASTEWIVFWPVDGIVPKYLCYYLQQNVFRDFLAFHASGIGGSLMRVKAETLADFPLLLPPTNEQHRIVAKIEELFSHLDAGVAALERAKANLKRYRAAVLKAAVEGGLTAEWRARHPDVEPASELLKRILAERRRKWEEEQLAKYAAMGKTPKNWREKYREPAEPDVDNLPPPPEGWCWATIGQIAQVQGGIQKTPRRIPKSNRFPYLRVENVLRDRLDLTHISFFELFEGELEKFRLEPGDLLVVEGNGSKTEIGRSALWNGEIENCVHQNHIIRIRFLVGLPAYFNYYWNSPQGMNEVIRKAASTSGLYTLSVAKVSAIPVLLPPLDEQAAIVSQIQRELSIVDRAAIQIESCTRRSFYLRQSILKKAFEGKLVPQYPNDEPASVLLERIRAERMLSEGTKAKRAAGKGKARKRKGAKAS